MQFSSMHQGGMQWKLRQPHWRPDLLCGCRLAPFPWRPLSSRGSQTSSPAHGVSMDTCIRITHENDGPEYQPRATLTDSTGSPAFQRNCSSISYTPPQWWAQLSICLPIAISVAWSKVSSRFLISRPLCCPWFRLGVTGALVLTQPPTV